MEKQVMQFLKDLEAAIPPGNNTTTGRPRHHVISYNTFGSDEDGWQDRLGLHVWRPDGRFQTFFLNDGEIADSAKSIAEVQRWVAEELPEGGDGG